MSNTNKQPLEFTKEPKLSPMEPRHKDFLFYLADGHSLEQACNLVGATRAAYEKWRVRVEGFRAAVQAARENHRRNTLCGFHVADAYARCLLDAIQRDEALPATLRYRAAKTILTRKGKTDWLPDPLPADAEPLIPYDEQPETLPNQATAQRASSEHIPPAQPPQAQHQNPDNPDKPDTALHATNAITNQPDNPATTTPQLPLAFFNNPDRHPLHQSEPPAASIQPAPSDSPQPALPPSLSETWLSNTFLHKHESPQAFERLLDHHLRAYQPATPPEELLVFRIAQKAWLLRRVETWERVIADSSVAKVRAKNPNAAAPACIALALFERKQTAPIRFYDRTAKLRKEHEEAHERLESKLHTIQHRRKAADPILAAQPFSKRVPQTTTGAPNQTSFSSSLPPQRHP
ncbi:MAG: hypothetical protein U5J83_16505 [Bryobacterales bacterium]|nr:hypothetical protein [Bryobacterales bacterium]